MQAYEAVRWAIDRLNKKNEELNGEFLTDSYIPGITLGKIVGMQKIVGGGHFFCAFFTRNF